MLILIGVLFCLMYLYSMMEDIVTRKVNNKISGLKKKYDDTVKEYNVLQLAKKIKEKKRS